MTEKKRVLLVDDQAGILKVLRIQLKIHGFDVATASTGTEAVEMVREREPDVILLDILLPDINGFDVLARVKEFSQVPIIAFTANPSMAQKAITMGAVDSISKPFDVDRLSEKIKLVLDGQPGP
jgi:two-component system KDP operon response regulator KdpE